MHAAAAETGCFAGGIQAGEDLSAGREHPAVQVGFESAECLASQDIQLHGDQRAGFGIEDPVRFRGPDQLVAQVVARLANRGDLQVLAEWIGELRVAAL